MDAQHTNASDTPRDDSTSNTLLNDSPLTEQSDLKAARRPPIDDRGPDPDPDRNRPPLLKLAIQSAAAAEAFVRPGGQATIVVRGTVQLMERSPLDSFVLTITTNIGGVVQTFGVGEGAWSASASVPYHGPIGVSATVTVDYVYSADGGEGSSSKAVSATAAAQTDGTQPTVQATLANNGRYDCPPPGQTTSLVITGSAADTESGVAWVGVGLDPHALTQVTPVSGWSAWSATLAMPSGMSQRTVFLRAVDGVGNVTETTLAATPVDVSAPVLTITAPPLAVYDDGPITVRVDGTAIDAQSGVSWARLDLLRANGSVALADIHVTWEGHPGPNQLARWFADLRIEASGPYTIVARAGDHSGNTTPQPSPYTASLDVAAIPRPVVQISAPADQAVLPGNEQGASVTVTGHSSATLSNVVLVEVSVDNGPYQAAIPQSLNDWSQWSAPVTIPANGSHTITARATSTARNENTRYGIASVRVQVGVAYKPQDLEDNLSPLAYLRDLLAFAKKRVSITDGTTTRPLAIGNLVQNLYQPFDRIKADERVQQVRISVEVLRAYLATLSKTPDPAAQVRYCRVAYQAMLTQIGTSYDEIRLARTASPDTRKALATRIGIELHSQRPDQLDLLLFAPEQITEAHLEQFFGIEDTTRDPLAPNAFPKLLEWQIERLRADWLRQDHTASSTNLPIIDPDRVQKADLRNPTAGNLAYDLWFARGTWLNNQLDQIANNTQSNESDQARFDQLVGGVVAPWTIAAMVALDTRQREGHDIENELSQHCLTLPAFSHLMKLRDIASTGALLESEWADIYAILVQTLKVRQYEQWRMEEATLVLAPEFFNAPNSAQTTGELPAWRAEIRDRRAWQEKLHARSEQLQATTQALLAAIAAAEETTLPLLRDALVAALGTDDTADVANWLTERLLIDVKANGFIQTTRITQAIETVQGVLAALRTGRFDAMETKLGTVPMSTWALTEAGELFDMEWTWMGQYDTWRAAMLAFLYPENLLRPSLREDASPQFQNMIGALRKAQPVSPQTARTIAAAYLDEVEKDAPTVISALAALRADWEAQTLALASTVSESDLPKRAAAIQDIITRNKGGQPLQRYMEEIFYFIPIQIGLLLNQAGQYTAALDWFRTVYAYNLPEGQRKIFYGLKQEEGIPSVYQTTDQWLINSLNPHDIAPLRANAHTRFVLLSVVRCFLDYADAEFAADTNEATARARALYITALDLLDSPDMQLPGVPGDPAATAGFAPNPEPQALRKHAELNLFKLRNGRNIAGMQRHIDSYGTRAKSSTASSQRRGSSTIQPTPYRYTVLIERSKQLINLAQQMEAAYLSALEKRDIETYNLIKARHDLGLAQANVQLQDFRVSEANDSITLAVLQQGRAHVQHDTFKQWLDAGPIKAERDMLQNYRDANKARNWVAGLNAAVTAMQAMTGAASGGFLGTGIGAGYAPAIAVSVLAVAQAGAQMSANNAETRAQVNSFQASYERRAQEWRMQMNLAEKDIAISGQQIVLAKDHLRVVGQEHAIARMQATSAHATVDFLANKFTNAELYEWMSGVLGRVYGYFLQQATAIARLAQNQLAFERQEQPLSLIQADYWQAPVEIASPGDSATNAPDRRGLTGSARLLQDIYQLDQYAFETNKRKLQLSKTISLAQLAPFEFQQFRQTGVLAFATPTELFDQDFPGHYLRLIKRVRTSVVALTPPNQGIRATLSTTGLSRVTIGGDVFQDVVVRRDPELVALSSPVNATGVFELDTQSDMLLPFEGLGVDTSWMLQLPKAANPFDFTSIADVLITVEYTALHSYDYRQQVIQRLDRTISADRVFSLRQQFPDQWYDLHNPDQTTTPLHVRFSTQRGDFPPNLEQLAMAHVTLAILQKEGAHIEIPTLSLQFTPDDGNGLFGGAATTIDGVVSTRRGNASTWLSLVQNGKAPLGQWTLALPDSAQLRDRFVNEEIEDILLVITYRGITPAWPV
jgi:outer membrane lipoprotein SlyB